MAARRVTRRVWRSSGGRAAGPGERAPPPLLHPAPLPSPAPPPDGSALRGPAAGAESGLLAAFMSHRSLRGGAGAARAGAPRQVSFPSPRGAVRPRRPAHAGCLRPGPPAAEEKPGDVAPRRRFWAQPFAAANETTRGHGDGSEG